jgi:hypothetical protein
MFDVFYFGPKPGLFAFEKPAASIDQAAELSRTRLCWYIYGGNDYSGFDFNWQPAPWDRDYIQVFPSQWQRDAGVYLFDPKTVKSRAWKFRNEQSVQRLPDHSGWTVPDHIDKNSVDLSWHPDPLDPPYIYHFPSQHQAASGVEYCVPGARDFKISDAMVVKSVSNRERWTVPDEIDSSNVDFTWHPSAVDPPYIYHFPSEWQESSGLIYAMPEATDIKIAEEFPFLIETDTVSRVLDIFFLDFYNQQSNARWEKIKSRWPNAQKVRFANSLVDTIRRCATRSSTNRFWVISSENIYDEFDFTWHPPTWQKFMTHVFGSQWQKWSNTFLINRAEFERNARWAKTLEEFPNLNFVNDQSIVVPDDLYDIYYVDHGNVESSTQLVKLRENHPRIKSTRFVDNYLDTLKRIMSTAETEYVWVISSICDYSLFDFSWQPEPWQAEMIHVFASNAEKRGDTFYINVETFKQQMADLEILDWFNVINYTKEQWVQRYPAPAIEYDEDSLVSVVQKHDFGSNIYVKFRHKSNGDIDYTPCIWRAKDRAIHSLSQNNATALVPRDIKQYGLSQIYDYPEIDKTKQRMLMTRPLDVIYISNGETDAERWFYHLNDTIFDRYHGEISVKRITNVNGRTRAYQAAAEASSTDWFFAVFAKLEVIPDFDWAWQPDYFQEAKHYIFNARNPVNGLEYGHMGVIAYNRRLVLETTDPGLDFTLSRAHDVVPVLSAIAHFDADPWMTWRTAFREVLKLRYYQDQSPNIETEHRLKTWTTIAQGDNAEWCLQGARDAVDYYNEVSGEMSELMLSFDWAWLRERFQRR